MTILCGDKYVLAIPVEVGGTYEDLCEVINEAFVLSSNAMALDGLFKCPAAIYINDEDLKKVLSLPEYVRKGPFCYCGAQVLPISQMRSLREDTVVSNTHRDNISAKKKRGGKPKKLDARHACNLCKTPCRSEKLEAGLCPRCFKHQTKEDR